MVLAFACQAPERVGKRFKVITVLSKIGVVDMLSPDEALWTAKEVATFLKASKSWVYLHAADGTLPSVQIGGLRRFVPEQVRAYARGEPVPAASIIAFPRRGH